MARATRGWGPPLPERFCFYFSSKNAEIYAFSLRKTYNSDCSHKPGPGGGLIDPLGAEDVKGRGLKI